MNDDILDYPTGKQEQKGDKYYQLKIVFVIIASIAIIHEIGESKISFRFAGIPFVIIFCYDIFSIVISKLLINGKPNWHPYKTMSCSFVLTFFTFLLNYYLQLYSMYSYIYNFATYKQIFNYAIQVISNSESDKTRIVLNAIFFGLNSTLITNIVIQKVKQKSILIPMVILVIMWIIAAITLQFCIRTNWLTWPLN